VKAFVASYRLHKGGNAPSEIEDAHCPTSTGEHRDKPLRFAIADGSTEGMLSGQWAEILVKTFCRSKESDPDPASFLRRGYSSWVAWKRAYLEEREKGKKPIQWYEEAGLKAGAYATFLGLSLSSPTPAENAAWSAFALGDSCMFQVRESRLLKSFPLESSSEFSSRPFLLASDPRPNFDLISVIKSTEGEWRVDDKFLLMTDALAQWFLKDHENGGSPWAACMDFDLENQKLSFEGWVHELRDSGRIRNDDVTLLRIDMG
jgi:hypothetical protein